MPPRALAPLISVLALVWLSGCITVPEFHALQRDVDQLKQGQTGTASSRLADMGAEIASLHEEVAQLRGEIEEARHLAEQAQEEARAARELGSRQGTAAPSVPAASPGTGNPAGGVGPTGQVFSGATAEVRSYEEAFRYYRAGDHRAAIDRFQSFLQTHPSSDYADNALFWMGECHLKLGDYEQAAVTFDRVVRSYPDGNKVPDALYRQGVALLEIGQRTGQSDSYTPAARQIFQRIIRDHADSERVAEARRQLEILSQ